MRRLITIAPLSDYNSTTSPQILALRLSYYSGQVCKRTAMPEKREVTVEQARCSQYFHNIAVRSSYRCRKYAADVPIIHQTGEAAFEHDPLIMYLGDNRVSSCTVGTSR